MDIKLYSTGCPKCIVLKSKLDKASLNYEIVSDRQQMLSMNFVRVPVLEVDGKQMNFMEANQWINENGGKA